jgi:hypothetical protein
MGVVCFIHDAATHDLEAIFARDAFNAESPGRACRHGC